MAQITDNKIEFFPVIELSRDDIAEELERSDVDTDRILEFVNIDMTDKEMQKIADKIGKRMTNSFWINLFGVLEEEYYSVFE